MHRKMRTKLGYFLHFSLILLPIFWSKRASVGPFLDRIYWPAFVWNTYFNEEFDYRKVANSCELTDIAVAIFVGMLDTPAVSTESGGGGSQSDLPWRDKDDDDDLQWARRCARAANPPIGQETENRIKTIKSWNKRTKSGRTRRPLIVRRSWRIWENFIL